jgi:superfamily II DNA helicase RecQ
MARNKPTNATEFARVFGVGESKLRDFAQPFLAVISKFSESTERPDNLRD